MEKKSRVSRYKDLRDQMYDVTIEPQIESKPESQEYQPVREKNISRPSFKMDDFDNEYLEGFINEVKEYNMKKGNSLSWDTQMDILKDLQQNAVARDEYIDEIDEIDESEELDLNAQNYFEDISKQVEELLNDSPITETPTMEETVKQQEVEISNNQQEDSLLEQTRKIELKMDQYQDNVDAISNKVNRTNFVLNLIVAILIVLILVVIGFAIFYILNIRGQHGI